MRRFVLVLLVMGAPAVAQAQFPVPALSVASGTAKFYGSATIATFSGETAQVTGHAGPASDLRAASGWFELPVATLKTGNDTRDRHMREALDADQYPTLRFEVDSVRVKQVHGDTLETGLAGRLILHGVTRAVEVPAKMIRTGPGLRVLAYTEIKLGDYAITKNLSRALILRVRQEVTISVQLDFAPAAASP